MSSSKPTITTKSPQKKPAVQVQTPTSVLDTPDIFGFFQDEDKPAVTQVKEQVTERDLESLPHIDLTENPAYLLQFCNNGFVWNEEVLLSPPFSQSMSSSSGNSTGSWKYSHSSDSESRVFNSLLAEKLRRQRIAQETQVAEIRID